jgi:PQQ-dependent dehydrogenase (methanol/ethanol family)
MRFRLLVLAAALGAVLALTATAMATPEGLTGSTAAGKVTAIVPAPRTPTGWELPTTANWPVVGGNYLQQRYSALNQITAANVSSLREVWHVHLDGSAQGTAYSGEGNPLVWEGTMYMVTGNNDVFALDAATGQRLWTFKSSLPPAAVLGPYICCGWDARGLAIGAGRVYLAQLDGKLLALDQQTGGILWVASNSRYLDGYTMTMAPLYYKGLVIVGVSGAERGARGSVTAYDADTGKRVWRFYTVPTPGDIGSGSWANNSEWQTGGATVWNTPAVDPATDILSFSTANPDPWSGRGPGDNLFSAAMVGLNATSGDYAWHFQQVHHDLWDYDCPSPVVFFDTVIAGKAVKGAAEPCKTGWLYEVDRNTGNPITRIDEKPVPQNGFNNTAPTQPTPAGDAYSEQCPNAADFPAVASDGKPIIVGCIWTPYDDTQFIGTAPGAGGGAVVSTSSFNPNTGLFYVIGANTRQTEKAIPNASSLYANGRSFTGRQSTAMAAGFVTTGDLAAYDVTTNKIVWKQRFNPDPAISTNSSFAGAQPGTLTTAGNLLLIGIPGGVAWGMRAYNATTGQQLADFKTPAGVQAAPITFSVAGKQYVTIYAGGRNTVTGAATKGDSLITYALP